MNCILGIDEAGRGAWAGPLVVGAVILGDCHVDGLTDSKLLSKSTRQQISSIILAQAVDSGLGWVSAAEIDKIGLSAATKLGILRVLQQINQPYGKIIIDGNINYLDGVENVECIIKADQLFSEVSAASVIAKVARDEYMRGLAGEFPDYGFDSHVGYGTKRHLKAIADYGVLDIHRKSFKPLAALV